MNRTLLNYLRDNNFTSQFNQALRNFLETKGYYDQLNQATNKWLGDEGYEGPLAKRLADWARDQLGFNLVQYSANGFVPPMVGDFSQNTFAVNGEEKTFSEMFNADRTGLATIVDSDGLVKWCPHNLLTYSEDFTNSDWTDSGTTSSVTANVSVAPDGTTTADRWTATGSSTLFQSLGDTPYNTTMSIWVKSAETDADTFRLYGANNTISVNFTATTEWQLFTLEIIGDFSGTQWGLTRDSVGNDVDLYVWGPHVYRSDLGGMAPVPQGDRIANSPTYVPTTDSPRFLPRVGHHEYENGGWVNRGLLVEPAGTNLFTYSNDFTNSDWVKRSSTIAASSGISPDGTNNASRWVDTGAEDHILAQDSVLSSGVLYTVSVWVKSNGAGEDTFRLFGDDNQTSGNFTATPEWVKQNFTFTASSSDEKRAGLARDESDSPTDILVYGLQLEPGPIPTSYIPTNGSTVTRAADDVNIPAANLALDNGSMPSAVSFAIKGRMSYADTDNTPDADNGWVADNLPSWVNWRADSGNFIASGINTFGERTGTSQFLQKSTGTLENLLGSDTDFSPGLSVPFSIASRHGATFINGAVDGTALTEDTTPTALADLATTDLLLATTGVMTVEQFLMWSEDIGDAGIEEASS